MALVTMRVKITHHIAVVVIMRIKIRAEFTIIITDALNIWER